MSKFNEGEIKEKIFSINLILLSKLTNNRCVNRLLKLEFVKIHIKLIIR